MRGKCLWFCQKDILCSVGFCLELKIQRLPWLALSVKPGAGSIVISACVPPTVSATQKCTALRRTQLDNSGTTNFYRKDCCGVYIMDENRLNKPYNSVFTHVLQYIVPHPYL